MTSVFHDTYLLSHKYKIRSFLKVFPLVNAMHFGTMLCPHYAKKAKPQYLQLNTAHYLDSVMMKHALYMLKANK